MTRQLRTTGIRTLGATLCLAAALSGCGGSSSSPKAGGTSLADAEAAASQLAAANTGEPADSADKALFSDDEACAWLKKNMAKINAAGDEISAQLVVTFGLSTFFEEHGGLEKADGYAFDDATDRGCKAEHDKALAKAKIKSFGNL